VHSDAPPSRGSGLYANNCAELPTSGGRLRRPLGVRLPVETATLPEMAGE